MQIEYQIKRTDLAKAYFYTRHDHKLRLLSSEKAQFVTAGII